MASIGYYLIVGGASMIAGGLLKAGYDAILGPKDRTSKKLKKASAQGLEKILGCVYNANIPEELNLDGKKTDLMEQYDSLGSEHDQRKGDIEELRSGEVDTKRKKKIKKLASRMADIERDRLKIKNSPEYKSDLQLFDIEKNKVEKIKTQIPQSFLSEIMKEKTNELMNFDKEIDLGAPLEKLKITEEGNNGEKKAYIILEHIVHKGKYTVGDLKDVIDFELRFIPDMKQTIELRRCKYKDEQVNFNQEYRVHLSAKLPVRFPEYLAGKKGRDIAEECNEKLGRAYEVLFEQVVNHDTRNNLMHETLMKARFGKRKVISEELWKMLDSKDINEKYFVQLNRQAEKAPGILDLHAVTVYSSENGSLRIDMFDNTKDAKFENRMVPINTLKTVYDDFVKHLIVT